MNSFKKIKNELPNEVKMSLQFSDYISFDENDNEIKININETDNNDTGFDIKNNDDGNTDGNITGKSSKGNSKPNSVNSIKSGITNDDDDSSEYELSVEFEEKKDTVNMYTTDNNNDEFMEYYTRNKDGNGNIILPPKTLFIENQVFSHLPTSQHTELLKVLLNLGKLRLFGWQNAEGLRKILKKFDKRFNEKLSRSLWKKIQENEFCQERKHDKLIETVSKVLLTRTIPFGHFDSKKLIEKGVNLRQMSMAIMQLDPIVDKNLREIIPMSVEPRSYLANERTFLKWIRMSAFATLVGMILISMKHEPITGIILIIISLLMLIRSYHEYYKRNEVLVNRIDYNWIDNIGPKLLLLSLVLPMITYIVYLIEFGSTTNAFHK